MVVRITWIGQRMSMGIVLYSLSDARWIFTACICFEIPHISGCLDAFLIPNIAAEIETIPTRQRLEARPSAAGGT